MNKRSILILVVTVLLEVSSMGEETMGAEVIGWISTTDDRGLSYMWPPVFSGEPVKGKDHLELCADGLTAWSNVMAGAKMPANFGEVIAKIATELGITGTPDTFHEYCKKKMEDR